MFHSPFGQPAAPPMALLRTMYCWLPLNSSVPLTLLSAMKPPLAKLLFAQ